jgi:hypothetical protein
MYSDNSAIVIYLIEEFSLTHQGLRNRWPPKSQGLQIQDEECHVLRMS